MPEMPQFTVEQFGSLIPPAVTIALLSISESLLCAVVGRQTDQRPCRRQPGLIAQGGIANLVAAVRWPRHYQCPWRVPAPTSRTVRERRFAGMARSLCSFVAAGGEPAGEARSIAGAGSDPGCGQRSIWANEKEFKALRQYTPGNATLDQHLPAGFAVRSLYRRRGGRRYWRRCC